MTAPATPPERSVPAATVVQAMESDADKGLGALEAARRLRQDGPNQLRAKTLAPIWRILL